MIDDELTPSALSAEAQADLEALVDGGRFATTGPLAIALVVVDRARGRDLPLDPVDFRAANSAQGAGAGGAAANRILRRHGVNNSLGSEGGRTSRGSIDRMEELVALQEPSGRWEDVRHAGGRRTAGRYGAAYATACNVLFLVVPDDALPMFHR